MRQNDYLEDEWPEDGIDESEASVEETEPDSEPNTEDADLSEEESEYIEVITEGNDFLNGEYLDFYSINEHRLYLLENPPRFENVTSYNRCAELCYNNYCRTKYKRYFNGFLHYYEFTLNHIVSRFMQRYAMGGHFEDLKQTAVITLLLKAEKYNYKYRTGFHSYMAPIIEDCLHEYVRTMRRGCTVEEGGAYDDLRKVMAIFNILGGIADQETLNTVSAETGIEIGKVAAMIQAAHRNMQCIDIFRSFDTDSEEPEDSREELAVSHYPDPYKTLEKECMSEILFTAWDSLDYREQAIVADRLGFCPKCFTTLRRVGSSGEWYNCIPRKRIPFEDIAVRHGLSSADTAANEYKDALKKLRKAYIKEYCRLFSDKKESSDEEDPSDEEIPFGKSKPFFNSSLDPDEKQEILL